MLQRGGAGSVRGYARRGPLNEAGRPPGDSCLVRGTSLDGMNIARMFCSKRSLATYHNGLRAAASARSARPNLPGLRRRGSCEEHVADLHCSAKCRTEGKKRHPRNCACCGARLARLDSGEREMLLAELRRPTSRQLRLRAEADALSALLHLVRLRVPTAAREQILLADCAARHRVARGVTMPDRWKRSEKRAAGYLGGYLWASRPLPFPLNYLILWCPGADLNHRHADFQSAALPLSYPGKRRCHSMPRVWRV